MNELKKEFIKKFVQTKNKEDEINFNLVLEKLNDFLSAFLNKTIEENNNEIDFKINLIGDKFLKSNYDYVDCSTIMIEYIAKNKNYDFSNQLSKKSEIGKLLSESLHPNFSKIPTTEELIYKLYNYLSLNTKDISIFKRKNGISLKLFDFSFFIFFCYNNQNLNFEFQIKGKNYNFNFDLMHQNLLKKDEDTCGKFFDLIKFYKIIERELSLMNKPNLNGSKTLYFYENLLYSLKNEIFESENVYDNFLKSYEYLLKIYKYEDFEDLKNAENNSLFIENEYQLFAKYYITKYDLKLVLKQCKIFMDNVDEIIKI